MELFMLSLQGKSYTVTRLGNNWNLSQSLTVQSVYLLVISY